MVNCQFQVKYCWPASFPQSNLVVNHSLCPRNLWWKSSIETCWILGFYNTNYEEIHLWGLHTKNRTLWYWNLLPWEFYLFSLQLNSILQFLNIIINTMIMTNFKTLWKIHILIWCKPEMLVYMAALLTISFYEEWCLLGCYAVWLL
jgi:hypothetical protein